MTYSFQTFSVGDVLQASHMNQVEVNVRDHQHGNDGVSINDSIPYLLVSAFHANLNTSRKDLFRLGFLPAMFNQQWGGGIMPFEGLVDGATGTIYNFDSATCYIENDTTGLVGYDTTNQYLEQEIKVGQEITVAAAWVKAYKVGNPTGNLQLSIYSDTAGSPNTAIANGAATAQAGTVHTSKTDGEWLRFVFATPPTLSANTVYHLVLSRSDAVSSTNYWKVLAKITGTYPHGEAQKGSSVPAWSAYSSVTDINFIVEPAAAKQYIQSGGIFSDGKLVNNEGSPLNQSQGQVRAIKDIPGADKSEGTVMLAGTAFTKDKTIWEWQYGLDHDRIVLRCNVTTGYAQVDLYESDGTKHTVTATSVDLSSGNHQVAVHWRAKADGSDRLDLIVDGAANGTAVTSATITLGDELLLLGHEWLGGGFAVCPTWTKTTAMGSLPSADGWTWTGTGTEANCVSVSGNKLYQNYTGYASTDTGYNLLPTLSLSNANGHSQTLKTRVSRDANVKNSISYSLISYDGTKLHKVCFHEYWVENTGDATVHYFQCDLHSTESVFHSVVKAADGFVIHNGKVIIDLTGLVTDTTVANQIIHGDASASASENTDAVTDYHKYYNTAAILPQFTSGTISEYALWAGDARDLLAPLYDGGSFISVKEYCGLSKNWHAEEAFVQREVREDITSDPTTTATAATLLNEMEAFVLGEDVGATAFNYAWNSVDGNNTSLSVFMDGAFMRNFVVRLTDAGGGSAGASSPQTPNANAYSKAYFGPHKVEARWHVNANTGTSRTRHLDVESRT